MAEDEEALEDEQVDTNQHWLPVSSWVRVASELAETQQKCQEQRELGRRQSNEQQQEQGGLRDVGLLGQLRKAQLPLQPIRVHSLPALLGEEGLRALTESLSSGGSASPSGSGVEQHLEQQELPSAVGDAEVGVATTANVAGVGSGGVGAAAPAAAVVPVGKRGGAGAGSFVSCVEELTSVTAAAAGGGGVGGDGRDYKMQQQAQHEHQQQQQGTKGHVGSVGGPPGMRELLELCMNCTCGCGGLNSSCRCGRTCLLCHPALATHLALGVTSVDSLQQSSSAFGEEDLQMQIVSSSSGKLGVAYGCGEFGRWAGEVSPGTPVSPARSDPGSYSQQMICTGRSGGGGCSVASWGRAVYLQETVSDSLQQQEQQQAQQQQQQIPCRRTNSLPPMQSRPPPQPDAPAVAADAGSVTHAGFQPPSGYTPAAAAAAELEEAAGGGVNMFKLRRATTTPVVEDEAWRSWFTSRWRKARYPYRIHTPRSSSQSEPLTADVSADGDAHLATAAAAAAPGIGYAFTNVTSAAGGGGGDAAAVLQTSRRARGMEDEELLLSAGLPLVLSGSGAGSGKAVVLCSSWDGVEGQREQQAQQQQEQKVRSHRHFRHPGHCGGDMRRKLRRRLVPQKNFGAVGAKAGALPRYEKGQGGSYVWCGWPAARG